MENKTLNPSQQSVIEKFISQNIPDNGVGDFLRKVIFSASVIDHTHVYRLACDYFPDMKESLDRQIMDAATQSVHQYKNHYPKDMSHNKRKQNEPIVAPVVTIFASPDKTMIIHSHVNTKGKMVLNQEEAALLIIELHKFIDL